MVRIRVVVEPKSPLVLGNGMDSAQNVRESRAFIAGSVMRGALAQKILQRSGHHKTAGSLPSEQIVITGVYRDFEAVFLGQTGSRFGYLYPIFGKDDVVSFPCPASTLVCKEHGAQHDWVDKLRGRMRKALSPQAMPADEQSICPKCEGRLQRGHGFIAIARDGSYEDVRRIPRRAFVHVGLNRWLEAAEEGILYSLEAVTPLPKHPLAFAGFWTMSREQWERLQELLHRHFIPDDGGYHLRLGSARVRGFGEVIFRLTETSFPAVEDRLNRFQIEGPYLVFSITARAPLMLFDERGIAATILDPQVLSRYLTPIPEGVEPLNGAAFVERDLYTGWSQAWGLPKQQIPVIGAGSVFTYRVSADKEEPLAGFLERLEKQGLGERRGEGCGDVSICDPFHLHYDIHNQPPREGGA